MMKGIPSWPSLVMLVLVHAPLGHRAQHQGSGINTGSAYDSPIVRFEYKFSFKGPYLAQKDGTVPFWSYGGNTMASDDMVRITPSLKSKQGHIWSKYKTNFNWWQAEVWIRVNGRGRLGADGVAFWFTETPYGDGPVFGSSDQWRGLGVFFDSFDNDGKGNNPYIMAMLNDGTKVYDHHSDGASQQIGGCMRDFRNKPFPVRAKIEYYKNVLTVLIHSGNTNNEDEYEVCLRADNVFLPQFGHFGMSAATGGLADDHDALKFLTSSLHPPGTLQPAAPVVPQQERDKIDHQYEEFKTELDKKKKKFFEDHPDERAKYLQEETDQEGQGYDALGDKELHQIYEAQNHLYETLKGLNHKLDEILGRQERTLSMIGSGMGAVAAGGQAPGPGPQAMPMQRSEVESLLGAQREVLQNTRDIRNHMANQGVIPASAQAAAPGGGHQLSAQLLTEIRDGVNVLRKEMAAVGTKMMSGHHGQLPNAQGQTQGSCPTCVSMTQVIVIVGIHLLVTIGYSIYKASADNKHGKFY